MSGVLAVVIAAALVTGRAGAGDEAASIKDVMDKLHKGAKAPLNQLKAQLKSESPDWAEIKGEAKEIDSLSVLAVQVRSAQGRCVGLQGARHELSQERQGPRGRRGKRGPERPPRPRSRSYRPPARNATPRTRSSEPVAAGTASAAPGPRQATPWRSPRVAPGGEKAPRPGRTGRYTPRSPLAFVACPDR